MLIKTPQWYKDNTWPQWSDEKINSHLKKKWTKRAVCGLAFLLIAGTTAAKNADHIKELGWNLTQTLLYDTKPNNKIGNTHYTTDDLKPLKQEDPFTYNHQTYQFERERSIIDRHGTKRTITEVF